MTRPAWYSFHLLQQSISSTLASRFMKAYAHTITLIEGEGERGWGKGGRDGEGSREGRKRQSENERKKRVSKRKGQEVIARKEGEG